jgi:hypothetical protein
MNEFTQDIRDVKGPLDYPTHTGLLLIGLAVFGICLAIYFLERFKKTDRKAQPALPPWQRALKHLDHLENEGLLAKGYFDQYYSHLSDILRKYIEEQLSIRAPEMTTEEFLQYLKTSTELNPEQKESLRQFLESCDLVKFAKYAPDPSEAKASYELAKRFIEETKPKLEAQ